MFCEEIFVCRIDVSRSVTQAKRQFMDSSQVLLRSIAMHLVSGARASNIQYIIEIPARCHSICTYRHFCPSHVCEFIQIYCRADARAPHRWRRTVSPAAATSLRQAANNNKIITQMKRLHSKSNACSLVQTHITIASSNDLQPNVLHVTQICKIEIK